MTTSITLRREQPADSSAVFEVHRQAFGRDDEARLVDALRRNEAAFVPELSIVAVTEGRVSGHILFTRIHIEGPGGRRVESLALAPLAVLPAFQRQGIGGQLIREGLDVARQSGFGSVIVLGHAAYYPKFGFVPAEKWGIRAPFEVPANVFMALELVPGALSDASGLVIYAKEFNGL
jgi:predicted N-acetyltransferase YhbS